MTNCSVCNNPLESRRVFLDNGGPLCRPRYTRETFCAYCEWSGDAGLGAALKKTIAQVNKGAACSGN
jgi:hypothetical protein